VTQLFVGSALFPLFKSLNGGDAEKAWRTCCIVPAAMSFVSGILCYLIADDAPKGNYHELKKYGSMKEVSAAASFRRGAVNINSWIYFIQYATCFGVELTMNNAASLYFKEEFGQSTESAAAIASIFGWMNLFARGFGGYFSDMFNAGMGMKGRHIVQTITLVGEGAMILIFVNTKTLGGSIFCMVIFSVFVQAAEGSTFGIVPYIDPPSTGAISGIVGSGGNVGAVSFSTAFRQMDYKPAFMIMGWVVLASGFLSYFVVIEGQSGLIWGEEKLIQPQTLVVPEKDGKDDDDDDDDDVSKNEA
jgi:MFS transporter, NNP family, nitrate/nitrite transporter